ncbi:uncharacterized protein LOC130796034 [Actinidia eriantha]|uniref:uncharacterized protein LOC130796034 n=1 Tax=Actinidia eriantha TaxID=165200 RepID=UPI00258FA742|nr:uncharacterized protein LOC130796034 [Actinidia eriantha]
MPYKPYQGIKFVSVHGGEEQLGGLTTVRLPTSGFLSMAAAWRGRWCIPRITGKVVKVSRGLPTSRSPVLYRISFWSIVELPFSCSREYKWACWKDVVLENLRQLCLFKVANETNKPWDWWDYVTDFQIRCPMKEKKYNKECAALLFDL